MTELEIWQVIVSFVTASGIFTGAIAILLRRIESRIVAKADARRKEMEEKDNAREKMLCQIVQTTWAAITLSEAIARAVQRIPDAHCNGDMHTALDYAEQVKREQKEELTKWGIRALW